MWLKRLLEWNEKELKKDDFERLNFKYELQMLKISKMLSSEEEDEETRKKKEKKKEELEKKREKLIMFMKKDEPNVKKHLTLLNNFKTSFIQIDSIKRLLNHIENYIMFE